jgi:hypothetical protein
MLDAAVTATMTGQMTLSAAARTFSVPKSTLHYAIRRRRRLIEGVEGGVEGVGGGGGEGGGDESMNEGVTGHPPNAASDWNGSPT